MDSVLQSREADPEEVLINLGFAESEALAKIPLRFFKQPSKVKKIEILIRSVVSKIIQKAKGVSIENFKKNQEEIFGRYDSGFFGYRGLQGNILLYNELENGRRHFKCPLANLNIMSSTIFLFN